MVEKQKVTTRVLRWREKVEGNRKVEEERERKISGVFPS